MSIAITYPGLIKFFGDEAPIRFDLAFREGMSNARRARILGDEGNNHKSGWDWGGDNEIDLMLILFSKQDVDQRLAQLTPAIEAFATLTVLTGELPDDRKEPFGFRDGISQPVIEGTWVTRRALRSEAR